MTKRKIEYWVIPPAQDAEFVACMEDVLETYAKAYDPQHPVLCMDEQPVQLLQETRVPIAATKQHGTRVDDEDEIDDDEDETEVPADLEKRVRDYLVKHPTVRWDQAVEEIAGETAA